MHIKYFILFSAFNFSLCFAQVTKLPTYAIHFQYNIKAVSDTNGLRAGDKTFYSSSLPKDSILFHYNNKGQLIREQIYRTELYYDSGKQTSFYSPDTSRYFRDHIYDSEGRKRAIRHGTIYGSPDRNNQFNYQPYPFGGPTYFSFIHRLDSIGYDSHDNQLFFRSYDMFDFIKMDFRMVIKDNLYGSTWEKEYEYDALGRVVTETNFVWNKNVRSVKGLGYGLPPFDLKYFYKYYGNTSTLSSRGHMEYGQYIMVLKKDSLFSYDKKGRIIGAKKFGVEIRDPAGNVRVDYTSAYGGKTQDTTVYFDNNGSYQNFYYGNCRGKRFYDNGKLFFDFKGDLYQANLCGRYGAENSVGCYNINHYKYDNDGNLLARDSAYTSAEHFYGNYDVEYWPKFDTVAYYGFRDIAEITGLAEYGAPLISQEGFDLHPNPALDQVFINAQKPGTLKIVSMEGIIVLTQAVQPDKTNQIFLPGLSPGLYVAELNGLRKKLLVK